MKTIKELLSAGNILEEAMKLPSIDDMTIKDMSKMSNLIEESLDEGRGDIDMSQDKKAKVKLQAYGVAQASAKKLTSALSLLQKAF